MDQMDPVSRAETVWTIREYVAADLQQVYHVHDLARVMELASGGVDAQAFRPMKEVADIDEFFVSKTLVACVATDIVGFVSWNGDYISWLYVNPDYHRRGIGRRLLREALGRIGPEAWTNMLEGNEPALALYREAGMQIVSARPSDCEGYACTGLRLALPTSRMRDPAANRPTYDKA